MNNNGAITFTEEIPKYIPDLFGNSMLKLIAPYWADVDTRAHETGLVRYRETSDPQLLGRAAEEIHTAFVMHGDFSPTLLFTATWDHVGYFNMKADKV